MRKLVTIQKILEVNPIPDADKIEMLKVLGWEVVSQKGNFKVGDLCLFFEIDSFLPVHPEFEFLRKGCFRKMADGSDGFRLRTVRLRSQISQGLALPLDILNKFEILNKINLVEGTDLTELLGVKKWEPPVPSCLEGKMKNTFPSFVPKSDETRIQVLQSVLTEHKGLSCYYSEKLDGTSITSFVNNGEFGVCGRNNEWFEDEANSYWKVARQLKLEEKLKSLDINIAYQGELIGEGIQGNKYKLIGQTAYCFNLFNIDKYEYFEYKDLVEIIKKLDIPLVPILDDNFILIDNIPTLTKLANIKSKLNPNADAEGIVIRPLENIKVMRSEFDFAGGRLSFKSINPLFLLEEME